MGYRAEKMRVEKKLKLLKRILLGILLLIILALCIFSVIIPPSSWKYYVGLPQVTVAQEGELRVHFLDVGQGDCTLVELPDGKVMLIDGGDGSGTSNKNLLRHLNALKIDVIDYLIVTHTDADHCGGLRELLRYKKVLNAYLPPLSPEKGYTYAEFYAALVKTETRRFYASRSVSLVGGAKTPYKIEFLSPLPADVSDIISGELEVDDEHKYTSVVWLDYMDVSVLFTGDIPMSLEEELMLDDRLGLFEDKGVRLSETEILKVSHHGSASSTGAELIEYLGVQDAIISCGKDNAYGHPSADTLARLDNAGVTTYRTDLSGDILLTIGADGNYCIEK